jgi:hypothetical protein
LLLPATSNASIIGYNFEWTGSNNYTMSGMFTYDDLDATDGAIRDGEVVSIMFEGFLSGVPIGSNNDAHNQAGFNFNFNAVSGQFFLGEYSGSDDGQRWNVDGGAGLGWLTGSGSSHFNLDGSSVTESLQWNPSTLTASIKKVPEPTTLLFLGLGLAGLGSARPRPGRGRVALPGA